MIQAQTSAVFSQGIPDQTCIVWEGPSISGGDRCKMDRLPAATGSRKLKRGIMAQAKKKSATPSRSVSLKKRSPRKSAPRKSSRPSTGHRWVASVTTVSTFPPAGLFTKDAATVARSLASKKVSPKGPRSGMSMLNYFINRAGHGLSKNRRAELELAKKLLSEKIQRSKS